MTKLYREVGELHEKLVYLEPRLRLDFDDSEYRTEYRRMKFKWDDEAQGIALTIEDAESTYLDFFGLTQDETHELYEFLQVVFSEE